MSNSREEETYSTIFTSLKHPIRRKILRMLYEHSKSFSEMQEIFRIESSHLTYHLENLKELIYKTDDGRYKLSTFGEAAVTTMSKVEEAPKNPSLSIKWKSFFVLLIIGLVVLAGVSYNQYWSLNRLSTEHGQLSTEFEELSLENQQLSAENQRVNESNLFLESKYNGTLGDLDYLGQLYNGTMEDLSYLGQLYNGTMEDLDYLGQLYSGTLEDFDTLRVLHEKILEDFNSLGQLHNDTLEDLSYVWQLYNETMDDFNDLLQQACTGTIYIRADGSILGTDRIQRDGNVYTFTANIYDEIVVEKDNIVVDGAGYTLQGTEKRYWPLTPTTGIELSHRSNVTITDIVIKGFQLGIRLNMSSSNTISGNNIRNNDWHGISLSSSSNNTISGNNIKNSYRGLCLFSSSNNAISGNNIEANNMLGIWLERSSNNTFKNNDISNNEYNFGVYGESLSHYIQDVDDSNTVNGKPVHYWVNRGDMAVPLDAGYVGLVNCTNISVQNLNLTNNGQGVLLAFTTNSTIINNNITNNRNGIELKAKSSNNTISGNNIKNSVYYGVRIRESSNNTISGNTITEINYCGFGLYYSSSNTISRNNIADNEFGIELPESSNNTVTGNNIANNSYGIFLHKSYSNKFYHNNCINNTRQVVDYCECEGPHPGRVISINSWDDGYPSGGNYWSNYTGVDLNHDGLGDTPHVIDANNTDYYPLMGMFSVFNATSEHQVQTICNSLISDFQFNGTAICFNVTGEDTTTGFCRLCIPRALKNETCKVFVNGTEVPCDLLPCSNHTHRYLYFTYTHSTQEVIIVPEFPTWTSILLLLIVLTVAVVIYKRRLLKTPIQEQSSSMHAWCGQ